MEIETFHTLLRGIQVGDDEAAAQFVRRHGAAFRRLLRLHVTAPRPPRADESLDVWQSVLTMFLQRAADGRLDLEQPEQLRLLLSALAEGAATGRVRAWPNAPEEEVCRE